MHGWRRVATRRACVEIATRADRWSGATQALELCRSAARCRAGGARLAPSIRGGRTYRRLAPNSPEWILLEFGVALAGLTLVTVNPACQADELAYVLGQSEAVALFVAPEYGGCDLLAVVREAQPRLSHLRRVISFADWRDSVAVAKRVDLPAVTPNDTAQIQYTSGTTGFPKGARLSHRGLVNNARFFARCIGATAEDRWVNPMPLFRTAGSGSVTLGALQTGGAHIVLPGFDAVHMLDVIEAEQATVVLGSPTMLIGMLECPDFAECDASSVRLIASGEAPVSPALVHRVEREIGARMAIGYGLTEASPYITHTEPGQSTLDWALTMGRPLPRSEVKIVDPESGLTLPMGQSGENMHLRRCRDDRLFQQSGGDSGARRRRLVTYGRSRPHGCGGLLPSPRPAQGHNHPRQRKYLSSRD